MSDWSDRRLRWVAAAAALFFCVGPVALLLGGGQDAWLAVLMLATAPFVFALAPAWAFIVKREKTDDDRLRMVASITSWPSLIAQALAVAVMGTAAGWKISGTTGAFIGALLAIALEAVSLIGQRRSHHLMKARLRGEPVEPAPRPSVARIALGILTIVGSLLIPAALGYALGGTTGAMLMVTLGVIYVGAIIAISHHRRRNIQTQQERAIETQPPD